MVTIRTRSQRARLSSERSTAMKKMWQAAARMGVGAGVALVAMAGIANARSTTNRPASIVVWPKIVVDTSARWLVAPTDTRLMLSSTNARGIQQAHCFYINATGHCSNNGAGCRDATDCDGGECVPSWNETDFDVVLTQEQPLAWYASGGLARGQFPLEGPFRCNAPLAHLQCFSDAQCPTGRGLQHRSKQPGQRDSPGSRRSVHWCAGVHPVYRRQPECPRPDGYQRQALRRRHHSNRSKSSAL
jgi:hypothetical protein